MYTIIKEIVPGCKPKVRKMMPELLLIRHAKSSWAHPAKSDIERPLSDRGRHDAPRMSLALRERRLVPDGILCSPALRTRQTVELLLEEWPEPKPVLHFDEQLYLADPQDILKVMSRLDEHWKRAAIIGHNPGLHVLAEQLSRREIEKFPTLAVAILRSAAISWEEALKQGFELVDIFCPKALKQG
jgi:phosphohistidine phosphatase